RKELRTLDRATRPMLRHSLAPGQKTLARRILPQSEAAPATSMIVSPAFSMVLSQLTPRAKRRLGRTKWTRSVLQASTDRKRILAKSFSYRRWNCGHARTFDQWVAPPSRSGCRLSLW